MVDISHELSDYLTIYYQKFFPFKELFKWLNYGVLIDPSNSYFARRELSVTLLNDTCIRFMSFDNDEDFKKDIMKLNPAKLDIGAVYTAKPSEKKSLNASVFKPVEKEMVVDIDLTDYDEVRTCCSEANICNKCWMFIVVAYKIIDKSLREDFGFKHLLWVYSGRRGIHCWVCDERARKMDAAARKAVISYLEVIKGGADIKKKVNIGTQPHPFLLEAEKLLEQYIVKTMIVDQDLLGEGKDFNKILNLISKESLKNIEKEPGWNSTMTSVERWQRIVPKLEHSNYRLLYPRIDTNVSIGLNHLLKSPFCVHPKTGRICVPIIDIDEFDPTSAPTVYEVCDTAFEKSQEEAPDYKKTRMAKYINRFNIFLRDMAKDGPQAMEF
ncbi:primase, polypeptide 1, 49kDa [Rozella allomycis CSF55]|uniref:DNA primase n=1 Tax=Rozella allomycis (strain CSF55) TaxID=988480 RepID=A0A075AQG7_ROZAC|nr:DNA primase, small subunit domain-containing protein [Rozella allomycis CSF55]RKP17948.1 primase, polypeptide 1, 49kDa [Rozella allomycis CSF55]|eukprot:EPZ30955.1 DNA primase, small subunit domain-containing protein [Rozella allomycis CSF55]